MNELSKTYDPSQVEKKWYQHWEKSGFFRAKVNPSQEPYCIMIPPPNVTGMLHMGHVLNNTLQDILIRWRRMQGRETLWLPGTDHAGIATQNKVEAMLRDQGQSKEDLGREAFVKKVWQWKEEYGGIITKQLRKLGASCDWSREKFTMDEDMSYAVVDAFVKLFDKGLIYKGTYIVNWCPRCRTALSDEENIHHDHDSYLWHIRYPVAAGSGEVIVATTRPETMLGDTAVAVHPEDERYQHLIGQTVILPILNRELPVIADEFVSREFGTGCVKITPAHDPNDFLAGKRHNLMEINVMTEEGKMNANAGSLFEGMDRFECRQKVVQLLEESGHLVKIEPHKHSVGHCQRCDTITEPYLSDQWFIKMEPLAKPALQAVLNGEIKFYPEHWIKTYQHWMENIRDWCISRQLWWGHRIPVYYTPDGAYTAAHSEEEARQKLNLPDDTPLTQDEDVLDTWASSWLWPLNTLGWPQETNELNYFYPTSDLVTAADIIFFWVARMIMAGLEFRGEIPFKNVYFNGIVRDGKGRKMSKSLGNSPDPLDIIAEYGADALRYTMAFLTPIGNDVLFSAEKCELGRNFANKLWNASRFLLMNLGDFDPYQVDKDQLAYTLADEWMLSRYHRAVRALDGALESFSFTDATRTLYDLIWGNFCDWYLELIKSRLYNPQNEIDQLTAKYVAWQVLEGCLRLLHPIMPFITEEIWQKLPHQGETIMRAPYPKADTTFIDPAIEAEMDRIQAIISAIRNIRGEMNVPPSKEAEVILKTENEAIQQLLERDQSYIGDLAKVSISEISSKAQKPHMAASAVVGDIELFIPLEGLIDLNKERERLEKEIAKTKTLLDRADKKLANPNFVAKAPVHVIEAEKKKQAEAMEILVRLEKNLADLS